VGGAFQLDHELVEELVDLVHLVAAEGGLEAGLLDLLGGEGQLVVRAVGGDAVAQAGQVGGGPFEQAADLATLVPTDDPGEGPRPDLFGREPAFGHGARFPGAWAVMATSSVLLDPVGWQTGTTGAAARFSWWPSSEEVLPVRRTLTILVLVTAAALVAAGCAGDDGGGGEGQAAVVPAAASSSSSRASASGDADADDVRIADFAFDPRTITAKVGQTVKWEHRDAGVTHTVTALDTTFDSGDLEEGEEFSHPFRTAGTSAYRCTIHTDMRGTVKVGG
jgi:plastocyanin